MNKKEYLLATIDVSYFEDTDVIRTSQPDDYTKDGFNDSNWWNQGGIEA